MKNNLNEIEIKIQEVKDSVTEAEWAATRAEVDTEELPF